MTLSYGQYTITGTVDEIREFIMKMTPTTVGNTTTAIIKELYDLIKQKRDNAFLERKRQAIKQDVSDKEKSIICAEICTYNDVLSLMESMFEVKENEL